MIMAKIYVIRIVLDAEEDVIRDIAITPDATLFQFHHAIVDAFNLSTGEMSSFFRSNESWDQGEEISMMEFDPETDSNALEKTVLQDVFTQKGGRMLFVYDYLNLWTFYLEVIDIREADPDKQYPALVGRLGETPEKAPDKEMQTEGLSEDDDFLEEDLDRDQFDDEGFSEEDWY